MIDFPKSANELAELLFFEPLPEDMKPDNAGVDLIEGAISRAFPQLEQLVLFGPRENFNPICTELAVLAYVLRKRLQGDSEARSRWIFRAIDRVRARSGLNEKNVDESRPPDWIESRFVAEVNRKWESNPTYYFIREFLATYYTATAVPVSG